LLDRTRNGQPEARAELFRRYAPQVRRILFLQGYCEELDDAVQEVFVKVYRASLPREEVFLAWFYRVILNTGRDMGRRRKSRTSLAQRLEQVAPDRTMAEESRATDPALRAALADLSPELREAVALRFFADLPLEQIAEVQDVPLGTVKSRLHAAMRKLRVSLLQAGYETP
jgi:RNA polymerase sigma-70 factor, ECF subfamily